MGRYWSQWLFFKFQMLHHWLALPQEIFSIKLWQLSFFFKSVSTVKETSFKTATKVKVEIQMWWIFNFFKKRFRNLPIFSEKARIFQQTIYLLNLLSKYGDSRVFSLQNLVTLVHIFHKIPLYQWHWIIIFGHQWQNFTPKKSNSSAIY